MPKLAVYNQQREQVGEIDLPEDVFGSEYHSHLLHLVVRKQLAARRAGTHAVKNRSDVSGGGRKPWKQKGTGRARQGSTRSPHWKGGGAVFGPVVRSHDFKVNKKEMRSALCSALSKRVRDGATFVVDGLSFEKPRTRDFAEFLTRFGISDAVVVVADDSANAELSGRNIPGVRVIQPIGVNVYDVLKRSTLVMTRAAAQRLAERLGGAQ